MTSDEEEDDDEEEEEEEEEEEKKDEDGSRRGNEKRKRVASAGEPLSETCPPMFGHACSVRAAGRRLRSKH